MEEIKQKVKQNYTNVIATSGGCCEPSCCSPEDNISFLDDNYTGVEGYEKEADYGLGCGLPTEIAEIKAGDTVLDLGSGAGNDAFTARKLTGEKGKVIGVDFTEAMIEKANKNKERLGYSNVEFLLGDIEEMPLHDSSVDVIISNCVLNLVPDKEKAYSEIFRVLKPGGHFSISDVVLSGSLPGKITEAAEMYASCIAGAVEKDTYLEIIRNAGFENTEIKKEHKVVIPDEVLLKYISEDDLAAYRKNNSALLSITFNGWKPKA